MYTVHVANKVLGFLLLGLAMAEAMFLFLWRQSLAYE